MNYLRSLTFMPEHTDFDTGYVYPKHLLIRITEQLENPKHTNHLFKKIPLDSFPEITSDFVKVLNTALAPNLEFSLDDLRIL